MNKKIRYLLACLFLITGSLIAKTSPDRIKGWLQLDKLKQKMVYAINRCQFVDAQIKQESNQILQLGIDAANELAQRDPTAAYALYHDLKKVTDATKSTSLDIHAITAKFQELSDYIDQQIKELVSIRRKHLQFPS